MAANLQQEQDNHWMEKAFEWAQKGLLEGEIPVGAVLVHEGALVAGAHNLSIHQVDPTAHAEINVLRSGALKLNNYRLLNTTLYVTLEPCCMCVGALVHARVSRIVFGAYDNKRGACGSVLDIFSTYSVNHHPEIIGGVLETPCSELLTEFFKAKRLKGAEHVAIDK